MRGEEGDALLFVSKPIRFNHLGLGEGFLSASRSESSSGSSSSAAFRKSIISLSMSAGCSFSLRDSLMAFFLIFS